MTRRDISIIGGVSIAVVALLIGGGFVSANNTAVRSENAIVAAHTESQNVLGQYAPRLKEALGVTKLQVEAVAKVITTANEARYGADGSQATMQWIREQNPALDQGSYRRVIDMIEAGRNDFRVAQTRKIDMIRTYRTDLGTFPGSLFYGILGRPSPGFFQKYEGIVISNQADAAFRTLRDDGVTIE